MEAVHGSLLIGGITLKDVVGELEESSRKQNGTTSYWSGRVSVDAQKITLVETGRKYRLELDDGRCNTIVVSNIRVDRAHNSLELQFSSPPS